MLLFVVVCWLFVPLLFVCLSYMCDVLISGLLCVVRCALFVVDYYYVSVVCYVSLFVVGCSLFGMSWLLFVVS